MKELHASCLCGAVALTLPDHSSTTWGTATAANAASFQGEITPRSADWMATRSP